MCVPRARPAKAGRLFQDVVRSRVDSMLVQDWITLLLASIVVAFAVFARYATVCCRREKYQSSETSHAAGDMPSGLNFARYILLLPNIIVSVMSLVHEDGGRVKYVCLNTVAVLFC